MKQFAPRPVSPENPITTFFVHPAFNLQFAEPLAVELNTPFIYNFAVTTEYNCDNVYVTCVHLFIGIGLVVVGDIVQYAFKAVLRF
jgi:hypothetical protein